MPESENAAALVVLHEGVDGEPVRRWFAEQGFEVGPQVGISFSIEAPRPHLTERFQDFEQAEGSGAELGLETLPEDLRPAVRAVVSESPPDFGPTNP
jgi:hypothetical protein